MLERGKCCCISGFASTLLMSILLHTLIPLQKNKWWKVTHDVPIMLKIDNLLGAIKHDQKCLCKLLVGGNGCK
jgi:hypothetical protein